MNAVVNFDGDGAIPPTLRLSNSDLTVGRSNTRRGRLDSMNRIQLLDHSGTPSTQSTRSLNPKPAGKSSVEHSFFVPLHYEPNYAYPLLVWLHGPGESHSALKQVMPHVSMRNYVGVAPNWLPDDDGSAPGRRLVRCR